MSADLPWYHELGLAQRGAPAFVRRLPELDDLPVPLPAAHIVRRAWEAMELDGALCVDGAPVAYFKVVPSLDPDQLAPLHRRAWNQGVAPVLVLIGEAEVRVYSTFAAPTLEPAELDGRRVIRVLERVADVLELAALGDALASGAFFDQHRAAFDPGARVDRYLVGNLAAAGARLARGREAQRGTVHLLLAQVLFACYLFDRGVIDATWLESEGIGRARTLREMLDLRDDAAVLALHRLFSGLHRDFNGDVFGVETVDLLDAERLQVLRDLLRGDEVATGQRSLGFWPYDFKVIPIETLSAVYEEFLEAEDPGGRAEAGAFYTPRTLAELVLDAGLSGRKLLGQRFLDPACGSGVFLVALFHRLVEAWRREHAAVTPTGRALALRALLCDHLFGVDQSETACRITALGLYLAWLDHLEPRDIRTLLAGGAMLPPLVQLGREDRDGRNVFPRDFFDEDVLTDTAFDVVVGNPPWGSAPRTARAVTWCSQRALPLPRRQLACAFVWKSMAHVTPHGVAILLLPASVVFNSQGPALDFAEAWLTRHTLCKVVNLADLGRFLFENSERPAICAVSVPGAPRPHHRVEHLTPAVTLEIQATDRVGWSSEDLRTVPQSALRPVADEPVRVSPEWKLTMRASQRDRRLLARLADYDPLSTRLMGGRWLLGEGFNVHGRGSWHTSPLFSTLPFVANAAPHVVVAQAQARTQATGAQHWPDERIFRRPHILFAHGVPRSGDRIRAGYSDVDCVFTHSIRGISAPPDDEDQLRMLACILASPLALYVFFHTSSSFGVERAKLLVDEYRRFPFPAVDDVDRQQAFSEAVRLHRQLEAHLTDTALRRPDEAERLAQQIDEQVYRYYEFDEDERLLVRWTIEVVLPSATPSRSTWPIPALLAPSDAERAAYCGKLAETLSGWTGGSWSFQADSIVSTGAGLGVVVLERRARDQGCPPLDAAGFASVLERLRRQLAVERRGDVIERGLKVFDGTSLYMVKPLRRRHWGEAVALSDADEVAAALLSARKAR